VTVATPGLGAGSHLAGIAPDFAAWVSGRLGADRITREFEEQQATKR
jgi:hypothetical protein